MAATNRSKLKKITKEINEQKKVLAFLEEKRAEIVGKIQARCSQILIDRIQKRK